MKRISKLLISVTFISFLFTTNVNAEKIYVNGYGGTTWENITKAFLGPLKAKTGLDVGLVPDPSLAKLDAMVSAGKCDYHVIELEGATYLLAKEKGLLQEINYGIVDPNNIVADTHKKKFGYEFVAFSEIIAYRNDQFPNGGPTNMAEFWDVEKFPGARTMHDRVVGSLEFALEADGVAPSDVYKVLSSPGGIDRAFAKLDEIKPHIIKFWSSGAEPIQMIADGEVAAAIAWNGRLQAMANEGVDVYYTFQDGNLDTGIYSIPASCSKESANNVALYLNAWTTPEWAVEFAKVMPYPPFTGGVAELLDPEYAKLLPTTPENVAMQHQTDWGFWQVNYEALNERWKEWTLE